MNAYMLLQAIGDIDDRYILSAGEKLGLFPSEAKRHSRIRRIPSLLAAVITAIAIVMSSFTVAMAVSEDFREAVIQFLGIRQTIVVPRRTASHPMSVEPEKLSIGGILQGTYVHTPEASLARNGFFMICTDEQMMNDGSHFDAYVEENGSLVKVEPSVFSQDDTLPGRAFHVEFEWVAYNGICSITSIPAGTPCSMRSLAGPSDSVLMSFDVGHGEYPVLVNLNTGEVTDILAGTGADQLDGLCNAAISQDHSKMLLAQSSGNLYYADLSAGKLYSLEELSGERPDACALTGNSLICWALKGASPKERNLGAYQIWSIDLTTMERRERLSDLPATPATSYDTWSALYEPVLQAESDGSLVEVYPDEEGNYTLTERPEPPVSGLHFLGGFSAASSWGNMYAGSPFAVMVDEGRNVHVMDLKTGEQSLIEGFTWPDVPYPSLQCIPSPDGQKLLIYGEVDDSKNGDGCISNVGVLDFRSKRYLAFNRENLNDVREETIYWFDNDQILIAASQDQSDIRDYYIYKLN